MILSSRSRTTIGFARVIAASNGYSDLTSGHLIAAILHEGQNPVTAALMSASVDLLQLQRDVAASLRHCAVAADAPLAIPHSPGEAALIARAGAEAMRRRSQLVWVDHLYFAAVGTADPAVLVVLARCGITPKLVEEHLLRIRTPQ